MHLKKSWQVQQVDQIPAHYRARSFCLIGHRIAYVVKDIRDKDERVMLDGNAYPEYRHVHQLCSLQGKPLYVIEQSDGLFRLIWSKTPVSDPHERIRQVSALNGEPFYIAKIADHAFAVFNGDRQGPTMANISELHTLQGHPCYRGELSDGRQGIVIDDCLVYRYDRISCLSTQEQVLRFAAQDAGDGVFVHTMTDQRGPYDGVWYLTTARNKPLYAYQVHGVFHVVYGHKDYQCQSFVQQVVSIRDEPVYVIKFQTKWFIAHNNRARNGYDRINFLQVMGDKALHDARIGKNAFVVYDGHHFKSYRKITWLSSFFGTPLYGAVNRDDKFIAVYDEVESPAYDELFGLVRDHTAKRVLVGARRGRDLFVLSFQR